MQKLFILTMICYKNNVLIEKQHRMSPYVWQQTGYLKNSAIDLFR